MEWSLKNLILAGIGTVAFTYEKSTEMVDELVKKGELTVSQGRQINEELKRKIDETRTPPQASPAVTAETIKEILAGMNLATKEDLSELKERINKLENK